MVITCFGDSITYGAWDAEGGWAHRLRKRADVWNREPGPEAYARVYNLGIPGNTSDDVVYRFEAELHTRMRPGEETVCVFAFGINDSALLLPSEKHRIEPESFQRNVRKVIEHVQAYTSRVLFVGLTPVEEAKTCPLPHYPDQAYRMVDILLYNNLLRELCREGGVSCIDLLSGWSADLGMDGLGEDGLHPDARGHAWIEERVYEGLRTVVTMPF